MAKKPGYQSRSVSGNGELRRRLVFVIFALLIFRIGTFIPVPGINVSVLYDIIEKQSGTIMDMFNMFSGGSLKRASVFSLGIMPYISASIAIQLAVAALPSLKELKKEGQAGRQKINKYTRYLTLVIAAIQATGISYALPALAPGAASYTGFSFFLIAIVSLVSGTMFLVWLGEQMTERGIGNGISLIIFAGIVAGLPQAVAYTLGQANSGDIQKLSLVVIFAIVISVIYFVVFVERGQRRIVISYAKRQEGRQMLAAQNSHLPFKVNMAGVIPAIFASSIILLPATLASWVGTGRGWTWLSDLSEMLNRGSALHAILYAGAIIFFSFFYTAMQYNPRDTAENLKKSGAFIPGIRPGEQTSRYIDKIMTKLTLIGGLYVTFVCLLPEFMMTTWDVKFYFGGTSLLIVVVVIMDFISQIQTHLMSNQYASALKKANLKGYEH